MIECPRLLFPFAREIIATAVRNGGFPPLLLDPVDFVALYQQRMAQQTQPRRADAADADRRLTGSRRHRPADDSRQIALVAERGDEVAMRCALRFASAAAPAAAGRCGRRRRRRGVAAGALDRFDQTEQRLPRADQLDIDLGQQLGVEQRAVLGAPRIVDPVARAQIVEPVRAAGMLAARQQQRVDQPLARRPARLLARSSSALRKPRSNIALCATSGASPMNAEQLVDDLGEQRLVLEELARRPWIANASAGMSRSGLR